MDFYLILQRIMQEKQMGIPDVAKACNLSDSTVRSILARKQKNVALEVAFKLSHGLGVSLDRLNGSEETTEGENPEADLSEEEVNLLKKYQSLAPANRAKLAELLDLYLNAQDKKI